MNFPRETSPEVPLEFVRIPENQYYDYKTEVIFNGYKWDPQINDQNTIAKHVILIKKETALQLGQWAQMLSLETMQMEEKLIENPHLAKNLRLPYKINKALPLLSNYKRDRHIRLMRFDFHLTQTGWMISEVNSDVPGGIAEASVLPQIACRYIRGLQGENTAYHLLNAFQSKTNRGAIAFVHATSYSDDRQVMQFIGDYFSGKNIKTIYISPDHIKWNNKKAFNIVRGEECEIDGIFRFFPLEWLVNLPRYAHWQGYYDCQNPSCNNPAAIFAQSKRLPLIWDSLNLEIPAWKHFLPETVDPKSLRDKDDEWVFKPALGRVGEGISIKEAVSVKELALIKRAAKKNPEQWVAQRLFKSRAIQAENGESYHLCIGVFTVDGKNAGFYGRISPYPRIDSKAIDIPILISP